MKVLCFVQLLATLLFFALWVKMRVPLCLKKLRKAQEEEGGGEEESAEEETQEEEGNPVPPPQGLL